MSDQKKERVLNDVWDKVRNALRVITPAQSVPATPTIVNVTTTNDEWTLVATGLSGIYFWRLSERASSTFHYAYTAAPATYMTALGQIESLMPITALYIKRFDDTDITVELERWS